MNEVHSTSNATSKPLTPSTTHSKDGERTPPPLPSVPIETPAVARHTSAPSYLSGNLEHSRTAVLHDLKPIPIVDNDVFKRILPNLPSSVTVKDIATRLNTSKTLTPNGWRHWPNDPAHTPGSENEVFKAFSKLVGDIIDATELDTKITPTATLLNNPTGTPLSERRSSSQPDGYLVLEPGPGESLRPYAKLKGQEKTKSGLPIYWEDIAIPLEYKKDNTPLARLDDERKTVWSLHHILRNDPCRRFAFAITVENRTLRIWLCHRAGTIVSEGFDFMTDHDDLIQLVSSLAFATKANLGWDTTFVPIAQKGSTPPIAYRITVHTDDGKSETFTTRKIISDYGAEATQGRSTRIYVATSDTDGEEVVIKDSWQDYERMREGKVMETLMTDLEKTKDVDMDDVRKHFLQARCYGDVLVDSMVDSTLGTIMRSTGVPTASHTLRIPPSDEPTDREPKKGSASVGQVPYIHSGSANTTQSGAPQLIPYMMYHRVHHRIVFTQRGKSLHEIHDPKLMLDVLIHVVRGLQYMWRCGWIHRDMSPGNILIINNHGVLSDLEYAKKYDPTNPAGLHDIRTGTFEFMAIEVANGGYLFHPVLLDGQSPQPFRHNPLHDLESVWWVAAWSMVSHSPEAGGYSVTKHQDQYTSMFPKIYDATSRERFIVLKRHFLRAVSDGFPLVFKNALKELEAMRELLLQWYDVAYQPFELQQKADTRVFDRAYDQVVEFIKSAWAHLAEDTKFITLQEAPRRLPKGAAQTSTTQDRTGSR